MQADLFVTTASSSMEPLVNRTWVTRQGVHIDRIASAWLIHRFIDPQARFRFVASEAYQPTATEVRFAMFEGEFTHEGDCCTFDMLLKKTGLDDSGLRAIAEIVHDIDFKDAKFQRGEAPGIARLIAGIIRGHAADEERLARGHEVLDSLYAYFRPQLHRRAAAKHRSYRDIFQYVAAQSK